MNAEASLVSELQVVTAMRGFPQRSIEGADFLLATYPLHYLVAICPNRDLVAACPDSSPVADPILENKTENTILISIEFQ